MDDTHRWQKYPETLLKQKLNIYVNKRKGKGKEKALIQMFTQVKVKHRGFVLLKVKILTYFIFI